MTRSVAILSATIALAFAGLTLILSIMVGQAFGTTAQVAFGVIVVGAVAGLALRHERASREERARNERFAAFLDETEAEINRRRIEADPYELQADDLGYNER